MANPLASNGMFYEMARWAYQPVKIARKHISWMGASSKVQESIRRFENAEFRGLQIGCANHYKPGWINTDLPEDNSGKMDMPLDITEPLPFPDNYFNAIYGSEVIEHVPRAGASLFLRESYRTLRPGGVLRLTTPDVEAVCAIYLGSHPKADIPLYRKYWISGEFSRDIWINAAFRWYGHQFIYSFETLSEELRKAGFGKIAKVEAQQTSSDLPQLKNLEQHYGDGPIELYSSGMIVEATK